MSDRTQHYSVSSLTDGLAAACEPTQWLGRAVLFLGLYLASAWSGLQLALLGDNAAPIWPASGVGIAAAMLLPARWAWSVVFFGAALINLFAGSPLWAAGLLACGNSAEALIGALLLRRWAPWPFATPAAIGRGLACVAGACVVSALVGASVLLWQDALPLGAWPSVWWTWWSGDFVGVLLVLPLLLSGQRWRLPWGAIGERLLVLLAHLIVSASIFFIPFERDGSQLPGLVFLCFPTAVWIAIRHGSRQAGIAILGTAVIAFVALLQASPQLSDYGSLNQRVLSLQILLAVAATVMQVIAATNRQLVDGRDRLLRSQQQLRLLADNAHEMICLHEIDGTYAYVSPACRELLGYDPQELLGRSPYDFFHPADAGRIRATAHAHLFEGRGDEISEYRIRHRDGSFRWFETTSSAIEAHGRLVQIQTTSRDISQRKADEERLAVAQDAALHHDRLSLIGTMAGGVAHEFNNLNAVILAQAELLLLDQTLSPRQREQLGRIAEAVEQSSGITEALLHLARPAQEQGARPIPVQQCVQTALRLTEHRLGVARVACELPDLVLDRAVDATVQQVLLNLVVNAIDAVADRTDPAVSIRVMVTGTERLRIAVTDNGRGIPSELIDRIFEPFVSTKGVYARDGQGQPQLKGTGLGLSVCRSLLQRIGGTITVESTVDVGTTFTISLPTEQCQPSTTWRQTTPAQGILAEGRQRRRILIAEDETAMRDLLVQHCRDAGHDVRAAANGVEAVPELGWAELLLLDWQMPVLDGAGVLDHLAASDGPRPAVIVLSGWNDQARDRRDVARCLTKPVNLDELLAIIDSVGSQRNGNRPPVGAAP